MAELIEVRVLGGFEVRDDRGDLVEPAAWRTSKTRDLVRLLAMSAGRVVPADVLVEALWPDVDLERGRASLRTAASNVRQVLGAEYLVRRTGGLVLTSVWVDALAFEGLASTAAHQLAAGELSQGVTTAWDAVTLYTGDLHQDEPYAVGATAEREHYRRLLKQLLLDAADAACRLGWLRDAAELGHRALQLDPCAEAAYRVLMRTYSHLGETGQALGLYEACRAALADAYGADPGPETRSLHQELLQPVSCCTREPPFVGRTRLLDLVGAAQEAVLEEHRSAGFLVAGSAGSGRTRFVRELAAAWPARLAEDCAVAPSAQQPATTGEPLLLVVEDLRRNEPERLDAVRDRMSAGATPVLVLATVPTEEAGPDHPLLADGTCRLLALPPLSAGEVAELLHPVLGAAAANSLVLELTARTAGLPAAVLSTARQLLSTGQLLSTADGLVRAPWNPLRAPADSGARLLRARQQTAPHGGTAVDLLAVLDRPTTVSELSRLTAAPPAELERTLGQLSDLGLMTAGIGGYRLSSAVVRELAYRWLRPTVRRALHRRVAEAAALPSAVRVEHWLAGGEPALACVAALLAADEAQLTGDDEGARAHLVRVLSFARDHAEEASDLVALHERLAAIDERLGRVSEARASLEVALELARPGPLAVLARLRRRLARCSSSEHEALRWYAGAADVPGPDGRDSARTVLDAVGTAEPSPAAAPALLCRAVEEADATDDLRAQVEARVRLASAAGRRRLFTQAYDVGKAAISLAELAEEPLLRVRAAHALAQTPAHLGGALRVRGLLSRLREQARSLGDAPTLCDVSLTFGLVLHDLGDPELENVWPAVAGLAGATGRRRAHALLDAVLSLERGQLRRSQRLLSELVRVPGDPLLDQAAQLMLARLRAAEGDVVGAVAVLQAVVQYGGGAGVTLLVPEAAAHLALLQAPTDLTAARHSLALAVQAAGERSYPREQVCVLRARAALLAADGRPRAAGTMALAAALSARRSGLVFQDEQSRQLRTALLGRAARSPRPRQPAARRQRAL